MNGRWFNGHTFEERTVYSVEGRFADRKPGRIDRTLDLAGAYVVPPFAEAHNHNLGTGVPAWEKKAIQHYLADGVFYVKIYGNLPLTDEARRRLAVNRRESVDVTFAQATITAPGAQPITLIERTLLPQGYYPGHTKETLADHRYFTIDSEEELDRNWPLIVSKRPEFIKTFLWHSDEFEQRKNNAAAAGQYGFNPRLLPKLIAKARENNLRVSAHVTDAADFRTAVAAGVAEIAHLPFAGATAIRADDAKLAASRGITVVTTAGLVHRLPRMILREADIPQALKIQAANLKLLHEHGVALAIGSDNTADSSAKEVEHLRGLGVFDNLTLLKLWSESTPRAIFPERKIGALRDGYEASFLALEDNPLDHPQNSLRIKVRFKQGALLEM